jgi:flagellar M-ring protein FliF
MSTSDPSGVVDRVRGWWSAATPLARASVVTSALTLMTAVGFLAFGPERLDMAPLFTRLDPADAQLITEELDERKVPYELGSSGTTISVPRDRVAELRLELASAGLPRGGGVGFELFDQSNLMMTDFTQRVNYRRALQGELARTIGQMPEVETARVHLALPENSVFTRDRSDASASVYLKLLPGRTLSPKQTHGIIHLVSSSVENLSPDRVAVLDRNGRMLGPAPDSDGFGATSRALTITQEFERHMEKRIVALLEPLVGRGRIVARINADMDLSRIEETEENYDPDNSTLRSERTLEETTASERGERGGVAGAPGNLPQRPDGDRTTGNGSTSSSERTTTESDYAIPRTVRKIQRPIGELRKLSIAVLVDSSSPEPEATEPPTEDDDPEADPVSEDGLMAASALPLPSPEALSEVIKKAVGFDERRGDQLEVMMAPFSRPDLDETPPEPALASAIPPWMPIVGLIVSAAGIIGLVVWLTERKRARRAFARDSAARAAEMRQNEDGTDQQMKRPLHLKDQVRDLAAMNVPATVEIMKEWLAPTPDNHGG